MAGRAPSLSPPLRFALCSDPHYAGPGEQARGEGHEFARIPNPAVRWLFRLYRHGFWMRHPLGNNALLDQFLEQSRPCDRAIALGDYAADTAFLGLSDEATFESARLCLDKLRARFGSGLRAGVGDHELGKLSFFGTYGGLRLASWRRAQEALGLDAFWREVHGQYVMIGLASSLVALPVFEPDMLPEERPEWYRLRAAHLRQVASAFAELQPDQRVLLFCHDPTALPFLARQEAVRARLAQVALTIVGHLHSNLILCKSRLLAGMPRLSAFGTTIARMSGALREARAWRPFKVRLCPALAGLQIERGGGWCTLELNPASDTSPRLQTHPLRRSPPVP